MKKEKEKESIKKRKRIKNPSEKIKKRKKPLRK